MVTPREGLRVWVTNPGVKAVYRCDAWEVGAVRGVKLVVGGVKVVGDQGAVIPGPADGATLDAEARAFIGQMLAALRAHGLIAS